MGQTNKSESPTIPVRTLSAATGSSGVFASIFSVRPIGAGGLLVNDAVRRQVVMLDQQLKLSRTVLDSISDNGREAYGAVAAPLIPYLSDSTLFVDREARVLLVIDPAGRVVRSAAVPLGARAFQWLSASPSRVDARGNVLLREITNSAIKKSNDPASGEPIEVSKMPDSTYLLRANFETRKLDTVAALKQVGNLRTIRSRPPNAPSKLRVLVSPIETLDDWATLSDGTIAVVRGGDYHVDFFRDGQWQSSAKLPIQWIPLTNADKQRIVDSTRAYIDSVTSAAAAAYGPQAAAAAQRDAILGTVKTLPGASPAAPTPVSDPGSKAVTPLLPYEFVRFDEMPDYVPPLRSGYTMGDADGNLWILPTSSAQSERGELVYDVVSSKGVLTERVRIPLGRTVVAFGTGGIVYLSHRESKGEWRLEQRKVVR